MCSEMLREAIIELRQQGKRREHGRVKASSWAWARTVIEE